MIAQMHSCEQSDHSAKLSRDVESLGHHGTYETETAIKMLKASASPTPTGLEILERNCFFFRNELFWRILRCIHWKIQWLPHLASKRYTRSTQGKQKCGPQVGGLTPYSLSACPVCDACIFLSYLMPYHVIYILFLGPCILFYFLRNPTSPGTTRLLYNRRKQVL